MVARQETHPGAGAAGSPQEFRDAVASMHGARLRPEVLCEEMPAPQRIAPYAAALSADVTVDDTDLGTGRLILLHDPAGNDAWDGTFRCVGYVLADVEPEQAGDPMLAEVAWTWLTEALAACPSPAMEDRLLSLAEAYLDFARANHNAWAAVFDRDLLDPARRAHHRRMLGDLVLEYMTAHVGRA